jgi:hypothetical protein
MGADLNAMLCPRVLHCGIGKPQTIRAKRKRLGGMSSVVDWPHPMAAAQIQQA